MKHILKVFFLLIGSALVHAEPSAPLQDFKAAVAYFTSELEFTTNVHGMKSVVDGKRPRVTLVDVRSKADFNAGHVPGAINIPYEAHQKFEGTEKEFKELRKDGYNYVYCYEHHCNLAQRAARKFASLGYPVKEVIGGYKEWVARGYPIEK